MQVGRETEWQEGRQTDRQAASQGGWQSGRQAGIQTDKQMAGCHTDRQRDKSAHQTGTS